MWSDAFVNSFGQTADRFANSRSFESDAGDRVRETEVFGEFRQQFRVRWRIRGPEVIHRIDNAAPKEATPDSIHGSFREPWIPDHPLGQGFTRILFCRLRPLRCRRAA